MIPNRSDSDWRQLSIIEEISSEDFWYAEDKMPVIRKQQNLPAVDYSLDHCVLQRLPEQRLGKTILITDHLNWPAARVV